MFGNLVDFDFSNLGWGGVDFGDFDWSSILEGIDFSELGNAAGELFLDTETGEVVSAAEAAALEGQDWNPDLDMSGSGSGPVMEGPFSGSLDESPLSRSMSDQLRSLDAEGQQGDLWREQMAPFTGLTAQMPDNTDWWKTLQRGLGGLGDFLKGLGGNGGGLSGLGDGGGGLIGGYSNPTMGLGGGGSADQMGLGGGGGALGLGRTHGPMSLMTSERPSLGGIGGLLSADGGGPAGPLYSGDSSIPGIQHQAPGGIPETRYAAPQMARDPITGMLVPVSALTAPLPRAPVRGFTPIQLPIGGGGPVPMAAQAPTPRLSGLQRLLQEME